VSGSSPPLFSLHGLKLEITDSQVNVIKQMDFHSNQKLYNKHDNLSSSLFLNVTDFVARVITGMVLLPDFNRYKVERQLKTDQWRTDSKRWRMRPLKMKTGDQKTKGRPLFAPGCKISFTMLNPSWK